MEIVHTDGTNPDFLTLSGQLEWHFNQLAGGRENREEYAALNTQANISDAFVAYEDGIAVGCAAFAPVKPGTAEVKRVFVDADYRGRGISRALLRTLEEAARAAGVHTLVLETNRGFSAAVGLYRAAGYREIPNYGPYVELPESVCMQKKL